MKTAARRAYRNLKRYRKEWDERRSVWKNKPHHGPESNGSDAFLTWAQSGHQPLSPKTIRSDRYRDDDDYDDDNTSWMAA